MLLYTEQNIKKKLIDTEEGEIGVYNYIEFILYVYESNSLGVNHVTWWRD